MACPVLFCSLHVFGCISREKLDLNPRKGKAELVLSPEFPPNRFPAAVSLCLERANHPSGLQVCQGSQVCPLRSLCEPKTLEPFDKMQASVAFPKPHPEKKSCLGHKYAETGSVPTRFLAHFPSKAFSLQFQRTVGISYPGSSCSSKGEPVSACGG